MVPDSPIRSVTAARAASTVKVSGRPTTSRSWIWPRCSRRRSPSARKKKSNLARSAVWASCTKEENSMWLPGLGVAPHGGVVDAGEVHGQMDLLAGRSSRSSGSPAVPVAYRLRAGRPRRARSVPVERAAGTGRTPFAGQRHQLAGDGREVVGDGAGSEAEPVDPAGPPLAEQVGQLRPGVPAKTIGIGPVHGAVELVEPVLAVAAAPVASLVEEDDQVGEDPQWRAGPCRPPPPRPGARR